MTGRTLDLSGPDAEKLAEVLAYSAARYAVENDQAMEDWCRGMMDRLQEAA